MKKKERGRGWRFEFRCEILHTVMVEDVFAGKVYSNLVHVYTFTDLEGIEG